MKHGLLVIVILILMTLIWLLCLRPGETGGSPGSGESQARFSPQENLNDSDSLSNSNSRRSRQRSPVENSISSDERLQKLNAAYSSIVRSLEDDEATRATFIEKEELSDGESYLFEIRRHPNLTLFIESLCEKHAESGEVNVMALKSMMKKNIGTYDIPEGRLQQVWIKVPNDSSEDVSFASAPTVDPDFQGEVESGRMTMATGKVPFSRKSWRYSNLLPLEYNE